MSSLVNSGALIFLIPATKADKIKGRRYLTSLLYRFMGKILVPVFMLTPDFRSFFWICGCEKRHNEQ